VIDLGEQRVAVAIGDVVGRGVGAAAAMGQLRSATRALARWTRDPADLLAALDEFTITTGAGRYSTLAYLVLDTGKGELTQALAGHPPPILLKPDGTATLLSADAGAPLGVAGERRLTCERIEPGSVVVLYTDGLVERRGEVIDQGIDRLARAVAAHAHATDPEHLCGRLVDTLSSAGEDADDVAVLVLVVDR
jgi:serine phosphatase RsbU (regulator of sigma subunit)